MITINNVSKSFGQQLLFENAFLQINEGDKFALVGPNGAGKSTLLKMILGWEKPDDGAIAFRKGVTSGYLPQETGECGEGTVLEQALAQLEYPDGRDEADAKQVLVGLGFKQTDFTRKVKTLSGGWIMRALLAGLLLKKPDILLLDEPTNHLDLDSLLWLESYLKYCASSIFIISHDRHFINAICEKTVSMDNKKLTVYNGNYDYYLRERQADKERLEKAFRQQQLEIKSLEEFIARNRARLTTATRAQSAMKRLDRLELIELPPDMSTVRIRFPQPKRGPLKGIELKGAAKAYGDIKVYEKLDFVVERGFKMAFAGHNGAGKSTLLKMLAGVVQPDKGERILGNGVSVGYFSQHRAEMLEPEMTVLEEGLNNDRKLATTDVRTILGAFLFTGDSVHKKTKVLSGGEKSRLALAKLLLDPPDVLLLDEPTTHLDLASVQALVNALKDFEGAICCISHDIYFMNEVATQVVHVENGKVTLYPGNYDYFQSQLERIKLEALTEKPAKHHHAHHAAHKPPQAVAAAPRLNKADQRRERARLRLLKKEVTDLRTQIAALSAELADSQTYTDYQALPGKNAEIAKLNALADEKEAFYLSEEDRLKDQL